MMWKLVQDAAGQKARAVTDDREAYPGVDPLSRLARTRRRLS